MEAFEKTWKERGGGICGKQGAKVYWRLALEWTIRTAKELDEQDAPICMFDVIRQELKEE
jgi:hypothetical protein